MDIDELINAAIDQQPTRFASAFDDIMGQKIAARLEDETVSYAQQMFAEPEDVDVEEFEDAEDFEDEDFDDEEFDIEDLDLEDLDLDTEEDDDDGEDA
jgi:hypothetical protein